MLGRRMLSTSRDPTSEPELDSIQAYTHGTIHALYIPPLNGGETMSWEIKQGDAREGIIGDAPLLEYGDGHRDDIQVKLGI